MMLVCLLVVKILFGVLALVAFVGLFREDQGRINRAAKCLTCACLLAASCLFLTAAKPSSTSSYETQKQQLESYVDWIHRKMQPKYARKAKELIPVTLDACEKYAVEPLDMGYIFYRESSWRKFKGKLGELGPGHVMPRKNVRKQFDMSTLAGQIEASVYIWGSTADACKTLEGRFSKYASGSCRPRTRKTRQLAYKRARKLREIRKKFQR